MKLFFRKLFCIIAAAIAVSALCTVPAAAADTPSLNSSNVALPIGYTVTLKISGSDKNVTWSSKDSSVAEITDSDGKSAEIAGKKTGSTYIYAKADGISLKCKVVVKKSFITSNESSVQLEKGKNQKITLTVSGSKDIAFSNESKDVCSITWGKWNGNKISLNIKALKNGKSNIKVYAKKYSKSTLKTIKVEVGGQDKEDDSVSGKVIKLINEERAENGVPSLSSDDTLNRIAAMRAEEISRKFSHTRPDGTNCMTALEENGIINVYAAENIAAGQTSAKEAVNSWMKSEGHKTNILNENYTRTGVGMYKTDDSMKYYWVQIFTSNY